MSRRNVRKRVLIRRCASLARSWVVHKDTVDAILPGGNRTEPTQHRSELYPEVIERYRANIPLGVGHPEEPGPFAV
jgi:hypothetical protein